MAPGIVLQGKYRLISELGEGGMGAVWRAEDLRLDAPVAVKLMHPHAAASDDARARFHREAKAAANLRSPHVVQVLDFGVDEAKGTPFIAMELLEGESLRDRLSRVERLPPLDVARIVTHVARALSRAHDAHVIHRDLKPANIFLVTNGDVEIAKVLDFGIAKWSTRPSIDVATQTGTLLGTPHYMSPEQIGCSKHIDYRTDLWSLGVIAVECMTGSLPFTADNLPALALLIAQGRATVPSALGHVPNGFDAWFARATALRASDRFQSASELALSLRDLCEAAPIHHPIRAQPYSSIHSQVPGASVGPLSRTSTFEAKQVASQRAPSKRRTWYVALALLLLIGPCWVIMRRSAKSDGNAVSAAPGPSAAPEPAVVEPRLGSLPEREKATPEKAVPSVDPGPATDVSQTVSQPVPKPRADITNPHGLPKPSGPEPRKVRKPSHPNTLKRKAVPKEPTQQVKEKAPQSAYDVPG